MSKHDPPNETHGVSPTPRLQGHAGCFTIRERAPILRHTRSLHREGIMVNGRENCTPRPPSDQNIGEKKQPRDPKRVPQIKPSPLACLMGTVSTAPRQIQRRGVELSRTSKNGFSTLLPAGEQISNNSATGWRSLELTCRQSLLSYFSSTTEQATGCSPSVGLSGGKEDWVDRTVGKDGAPP